MRLKFLVSATAMGAVFAAMGADTSVCPCDRTGLSVFAGIAGDFNKSELTHTNYGVVGRSSSTSQTKNKSDTMNYGFFVGANYDFYHAGNFTAGMQFGLDLRTRKETPSVLVMSKEQRDLLKAMASPENALRNNALASLRDAINSMTSTELVKAADLKKYVGILTAAMNHLREQDRVAYIRGAGLTAAVVDHWGDKILSDAYAAAALVLTSLDAKLGDPATSATDLVDDVKKAAAAVEGVLALHNCEANDREAGTRIALARAGDALWDTIDDDDHRELRDRALKSLVEALLLARMKDHGAGVGDLDRNDVLNTFLSGTGFVAVPDGQGFENVRALDLAVGAGGELRSNTLEAIDAAQRFTGPGVTLSEATWTRIKACLWGANAGNEFYGCQGALDLGDALLKTLEHTVRYRDAWVTWDGADGQEQGDDYAIPEDDAVESVALKTDLKHIRARLAVASALTRAEDGGFADGGDGTVARARIGGVTAEQLATLLDQVSTTVSDAILADESIRRKATTLLIQNSAVAGLGRRHQDAWGADGQPALTAAQSLTTLLGCRDLIDDTKDRVDAMLSDANAKGAYQILGYGLLNSAGCPAAALPQALPTSLDAFHSKCIRAVAKQQLEILASNAQSSPLIRFRDKSATDVVPSLSVRLGYDFGSDWTMFGRLGAEYTKQDIKFMSPDGLTQLDKATVSSVAPVVALGVSKRFGDKGMAFFTEFAWSKHSGKKNGTVVNFDGFTTTHDVKLKNTSYAIKVGIEKKI